MNLKHGCLQDFAVRLRISLLSLILIIIHLPTHTIITQVHRAKHRQDSLADTAPTMESRILLPKTLPSTPLPHGTSPPPLKRSPSSLLGISTTTRHRRGNVRVRSSSGDTVTMPMGLANWRRLPKDTPQHPVLRTCRARSKSGSAAGTGSSSTGTVKKGLGMGMKGTPAKKGWTRSKSKTRVGLLCHNVLCDGHD